MTMAIETVEKPNRMWLGISAAVALVLLVGMFVWWEFRTPSTGGEIDIGDVPASARGRSQIQSDGKGDWNVWCPPASMYISGTPPKEFNVDVRTKGLVSDDVRTLAIMAVRVGHDRRIAQAVNATKDQIAKVRDAQFPRAAVSDDDLATMKKLWADYLAAPDSDKLPAKTAPLNGLHTVGDNSIAPTKKLWSDTAALAKSTFSADQIKKFQQYQRNEQRPTPAPTSQPTTRRSKPTTQYTK